MGRIIQASDIFRKDMYELILIQESLINDIDTLIKHTKNHKEREEIITAAVEKFIESATQEKIQRQRKKYSALNYLTCSTLNLLVYSWIPNLNYLKLLARVF